jgi:cysteine desulfurase / selenocysteine lyase
MDIKKIKSEFPIFEQKINGKPLVYLDSANSSQKPRSVIKRISNFYETEYSNVGRSVHSLAVKATNRFEHTRDKVKNYINAEHREEIIFTKGATEAINLVASSYGKKFINKGDEILITELEHHSNYVPWNFIRENVGANIKFAPVNSKGEIELDEIKKLITEKTKIIAITHLSNVTGAIMPIKKIVDLAKSKKIPVLVDGTQGAPHLEIDMQNLGCDFYAISCHKMYGPNGLGILYMKKKWVDILPPYQGGGGMIDEVKTEKITYASSQLKFEAGTMQTAEVVSFHEAINFIEKIGIKQIFEHENKLMEYGLEKLKKNNSINIIGSPLNKGSVISFTIKGIHPHDIATILDDDGVAIRAGHHCCQILHEKIGIAASARASFGVYNTKEDIDILCDAIDKCKKVFNI